MSTLFGRTAKQLRPPSNGGNTCYLDSVIVALFFQFDGWDELLLADDFKPLSIKLRKVVNDLRRGRGIQSSCLNDLRRILINDAKWHVGCGQQDAAELFAFMLDALQAPFVLLVKNLVHTGLPDSHADRDVPFTERMLWLNLYSRYSNDLKKMTDNYFYAEVVHGLRREGALSGVDAKLSKSLVPAYSAVRETGETVPSKKTYVNTITVPLAISRFNFTGDAKDRSPVRVPLVMSATRYVSPFANNDSHSLVLRSVICHLGSTMQSGHYVTYTYNSNEVWHRWDDMEGDFVPSSKRNISNEMPEIRQWADEITHDSYLLFYELVPEEGDLKRYSHLCDLISRQQSITGSKPPNEQKLGEGFDDSNSRQYHLSTYGGSIDIHPVATVSSLFDSDIQSSLDKIFKYDSESHTTDEPFGSSGSSDTNLWRTELGRSDSLIREGTESYFNGLLSDYSCSDVRPSATQHSPIIGYDTGSSVTSHQSSIQSPSPSHAKPNEWLYEYWKSKKYESSANSVACTWPWEKYDTERR